MINTLICLSGRKFILRDNLCLIFGSGMSYKNLQKFETTPYFVAAVLSEAALRPRPSLKRSIVMDTRQCLEILELECITSAKQLKDAYRKMVKVWHPDRFHGDSGLVRQAEVKIREINLAYQHLLAYFDPKLRKYLKTTPPPSANDCSFDGSGCQSAGSQRDRFRSFSGTNAADHKNFAQFNHIKICAAPPKSFLSRLALFAVFCFFAAVTCMMVYLIFNVDKITSGTTSTASGILQKVKVDLEHDLAAKIKKIGGVQIDLPPEPAGGKDSGAESLSSNSEKYYEIHLNGGAVIMTRQWWNEGDMVMFKQYTGEMGVEKERIEKIVAREAQ